MTILVTGGAGFIGSNFILDWMRLSDEPIVNLDALTYAGNLANLASIADDDRYTFTAGDIGDRPLVDSLLEQHQPRAIVHFAAESHVDRSIKGPAGFVQTNIVGTFTLLDAARAYWQELSGHGRNAFRFINVSTDEVYGSLQPDDPAFTEESPYSPNSPYSASKASADHLARSYHHTYALPVITSNCSNNYGAFQFPEKLIPLMVLRGLKQEPLPVYGDGENIRDWLYVTDHCAAIRKIIETGTPGETYNIGGDCERSNIVVVNEICDLLDELVPIDGVTRRDLITFVPDRPGHDRRYAIDSTKVRRDIGWRPSQTFETGLRATVEWYLDHDDWVNSVINGEYRNWSELHYGTN